MRIKLNPISSVVRGKRVVIIDDSLGYLSVESAHKLANGCGCAFCDGCFTGSYPVPVPKAREKFRFEQKLSQTNH